MEYRRIVVPYGQEDALKEVNELARNGWELVEIRSGLDGGEAWIMRREAIPGPSERKTKGREPDLARSLTHTRPDPDTKPPILTVRLGPGYQPYECASIGKTQRRTAT